MSKIVNFGKEARDKIIKGVDVVANSVKTTLGPKGRNAIIGSKYGCPQIINDGVSIAKEIELKDPLENAGAQLLKEVSSKTNDVAGDGTTTASVLAQVIIHEGLYHIEKGVNPIQMREGINEAVKNVVEYIKNSAKIVDENTLAQVASISAGNNEEIGKLIAEAITTVGENGIVTVEESNTIGTTLKSADGIQLDKGYISPYFITDATRQEVVLEKPYILLVNRKINLISDLLPILEMVAQDGRSLLLIAEDVEGEALGTMVVNTMRKVLRAVAVKAPGFGDGRKAILQDLAIITGGIVWTEELGIELNKIKPNFFGNATRVIVKKDETTIVVENTAKDTITSHVNMLKDQLEKSDNAYEKEKLQQRIAKLTGGVAVIKVGAPTEVELKEKKLRIEDALNATRAAQEEGIVAGGGYTLLEAQEKCKRTWETEEHRSAFGVGYDILISSLSAPVCQIAKNAGLDGDEVANTCKELNLGYNALTDKYENLLESGVIDPAKVTKSALTNAASIAGMLLTTETSIVEEPMTTENAGFVPQNPMMM